MNKRALMLTAAATALLSGHAYAASPCATTPETAGVNCDLQTGFSFPIFTGAVPAGVTTGSATSNGSLTIDTNGSLVLGINPPTAPAVTINSGTAANPTIVNNTTEISYQGITGSVGVLLQEASVATTSTTNGVAENWTGEYFSASGTLDMLGAGTNKTAILIAGGAFPGAGLTDANTGTFANTPLGVFTGATGIEPVGGTTPVAIDLASGSTTEVQGTGSFGINLIGPTFSQVAGTGPFVPSGGASLHGDIDIGGSLLLEPTTVGSTAATDNTAINIAGYNQGAGQVANPAFAAVGIANAPYAMIGNLNILSGGVVSSEGAGAQGVIVLGAMNGAITNQGTIETFGTTSPSTATNAVDAEGGTALGIGNNITGGIFNSGPSAKGQTSAAATISTVGNAPTLFISPTVSSSALGTNGFAVPIEIGKVSSDPDNPNQFSLINRGSITAAAEDANVSTEAVVLQGTSANSVTLDGGILNTGTISSVATTNTLSSTTSVTANAVTIDGFTTIGTGTTSVGTFNIINTVENGAGSGKIVASVSGPALGVATAIGIQQNAQPGGTLSLFNDGVITASATTTQPSTATGAVLNAFAIVDSSGSLQNITNQGTISASVTTLDNNPGAPINSPSFDAANEAVAISTANNSTTSVTINNTATANGSASIVGDVFFGQKSGIFNVTGLNSTNSAIVDGNIVFENATPTPDQLNIGVAGTVTGQIAELHGGSVDISIAQSGTLNYLTASPTNLNANTSVQVQKGVPLSVGTLAVANGGQLNLSVSQGYNVNVFSGVSVISAQSVTIGDPTGGLHPLTVSFGSFVATPSATNTAAEFVLIDSKTNIGISQATLSDLTTLYTTNPNAPSNNTPNANGIPFLFNSNFCTFNVSTATGSQVCAGPEPISAADSQLVLTLTPKTAQELGLTGFAAKMFPFVNQALINDNTLGAAMINDITNKQQAQAAYAAFAPDVSGATRATAISLTDSATNAVAARQRELNMYANQEGGTTIWGQQFVERLSQANSNSLTGYNDSGFGFVLGADDGDPVDGRYGGAFTFFTGGSSAKEPTSQKTSSEYYLLTGYTNWRGKGLFVDTQGTVGYGNLKGNRYLTLTDSTTGDTVTRDAQSQRPTELLAGSVTTGGILTAGSTVFVPQVDLDGLTMREEGYTESNGGEGFNLRVQPYYADSLRGFIGTTVRQDFNFGDFYLQPQLRFGYRYDLADGAQKLKASFASVGPLNGQAFTPFTIEGPDPGRGNLVLGGGVATTTGAWSIGLDYDYVKASDGPSEQAGVLTLVGRI